MRTLAFASRLSVLLLLALALGRPVSAQRPARPRDAFPDHEGPASPEAPVQHQPRPRDPLPGPSPSVPEEPVPPKAPPPLPPAPSPFDLDAPIPPPMPPGMPPSPGNKNVSPSSPHSTRLEVPPGSDIKITIEVLSKPSAAPPAPAPPAEPPPPAEPARPPVPRLPLPTMESIKPISLPPIPDDPPPHEGAMIELPYVVDPPDLVLVEVLEALPGRPISGERLVRPDGKLSLGFYGELYVRGLTITQIKEKVVLQLREFIPDDILGIMEQNEHGEWGDVEPRDTNRVFVDITAYNSKNYFVQGDVAAPGKLPCTGNETVLDALNYAGGLIPTADPREIRLVRPGRDGKPSKVYMVDYDGILERGETEKNYQLFPNDRLVVGRNALVKRMLEMDRVEASMETVFKSILQQTFALRSLMQAASDGTRPLTPAEREALVKEWADFWWKIAARHPTNELDEKTFREALMKAVNPPKVPRPKRKK